MQRFLENKQLIHDDFLVTMVLGNGGRLGVVRIHNIIIPIVGSVFIGCKTNPNILDTAAALLSAYNRTYQFGREVSCLCHHTLGQVIIYIFFYFRVAFPKCMQTRLGPPPKKKNAYYKSINQNDFWILPFKKNCQLFQGCLSTLDNTVDTKKS